MPTSKAFKLLLLLVLLGVLGLALYVFLGAQQISLEDQARNAFLYFLEGQEPWERFFIAMLFVGLTNGLFLPINLSLLLVALLIPGWSAFVAGLGGAVLAALIGYLYGKLISENFLREKLGDKRYEVIVSEIGNNAFKAVVLLCLAPIAPNIVTNMLAGVCRIPIWKLVAGTIVGFLPGVTALTLLGRELRALVEDPGYQAVIWVLAIVGLLTLFYKIGKKIQARLEREVNASQDSSNPGEC